MRAKKRSPVGEKRLRGTFVSGGGSLLIGLLCSRLVAEELMPALGGCHVVLTAAEDGEVAGGGEAKFLDDLREGHGGIGELTVDILRLLLQHPGVGGDIEGLLKSLLEDPHRHPSLVGKILDGLGAEEVLDHKLLEVNLLAEQRREEPCDLLPVVEGSEEEEEFLELRLVDVDAIELMTIHVEHAVKHHLDRLVCGERDEDMRCGCLVLEPSDGVVVAEL